MKKIVYILSIAAVILLGSCTKDPIGGTNVQNVSGEWFVGADLVTADGEVIDCYITHHIHALTFNTNANDADSLILSVQDNDGEIDYSFGQSGYYLNDIVVAVDQKTNTFGIKDFVIDDETYANVNGSIINGGTKTPSGATADKIEFTISLVDFDGTNILEYFWTNLEYPDYYDGKVASAIKFTGWRYTGLVADEDETTPIGY